MWQFRMLRMSEDGEGGELERHLADMHINSGPAGRTDWKRKGFEAVDVSVYMQCEAKELVMTSFALN